MRLKKSHRCAVAAFILAAAVRSVPAQQAPATQPQTDFKFDFGPGKAADGYTKVQATDLYADEKGYGFDFGSKPTGVARDVADPLHDGFVTTPGYPILFSVKEPEGNYRIKLTLGDAQGESHNTIRTEAGHLMAADISTKAGEFATRTVIANVRRPQLPTPPVNAPGGSIVHMFLAGESEAICWDDKLTIEVNGSNPCLCAMEISRADDVPTLFTAGDSTVGDPRRGPGGNWPTQMCQYFKPDIAVCNSAEGGETSKSFVTGQRMDKVLSQMKRGDFFLIQFGTNDQKQNWPQTYTEAETTYKAYLRVFIAETRRRGATLVLVTPQERRDNGDSVGPYARAMREVAKEENVPLIDQWAMSKQLWTNLGPNVGKAFGDQTHLSGYGGYLLSNVVVTGIKENVPELAKYIVDDYKEIDLKNPPGPPDYLRQPVGTLIPPVMQRGRRPASAPAVRGN
jgi:lysophospholipase L1-like esterase